MEQRPQRNRQGDLRRAGQAGTVTAAADLHVRNKVPAHRGCSSQWEEGTGTLVTSWSTRVPLGSRLHCFLGKIRGQTRFLKFPRCTGHRPTPSSYPPPKRTLSFLKVRKRTHRPQVLFPQLRPPPAGSTFQPLAPPLPPPPPAPRGPWGEWEVSRYLESGGPSCALRPVRVGRRGQGRTAGAQETAAEAWPSDGAPRLDVASVTWRDEF